VLIEKPGSLVAQFKITVMITKGKTTALTGLPLDEKLFQSVHEIKDEEVLKLINLSMEKKEQKEQKKAAELKDETKKVEPKKEEDRKEEGE
jgi:hypothetical protein